MKVVLASNNPDKAKEISSFLGKDFTVILQSSLNIPEIDETGTSFIENSLLKAYHCAKLSGLPAIADDSGLCVPALNNLPGVSSATYANTRDPHANIEKLLNAMKDLKGKDRDAFYTCALSFVDTPSNPIPITFYGFWDGRIGTEPRGTNGFGYDPIFIVKSLNKTAAEITLEQKNKLSHRAQALADLKEELLLQLDDFNDDE